MSNQGPGLYWTIVFVAIIAIVACIPDHDHAIVNAWAQDSTNAAFSYYTGDGMVTIQQDTVMIRGEFVVIRNGEIVP